VRRTWTFSSSGAGRLRLSPPFANNQKICVVNCDWLVTVRKDHLAEKIGTLSRSKLGMLDDALRFALGLDG
jgi:mRNA-degrading endonuclease toxin of MazEF toxin-antitoxin module